MSGVTITHWVRTPPRHQPYFEGRDLEDCMEDHCLFSLPGPTVPVPGAKSGEGAAQNDRRGTEPVFQVLLDVTQFQPQDILIQVFEGWLLVKAQHATRMDEHGFVSRSFTRQYKLPEQLQAGDLRALLCHDGILVVEAKDHAPGAQ
ncbi:heat shock protein beta-3 [Megalops cyprinoides]|uniref:heat shock protein beta-3 n=1 Tax=Megalops cyprinoides TaxID=118141 RepID=UPI001864F46B|nr:heat shock protein beta-3 [Megalops cyprinoides]